MGGGKEWENGSLKWGEETIILNDTIFDQSISTHLYLHNQRRNFVKNVKTLIWLP